MDTSSGFISEPNRVICGSPVKCRYRTAPIFAPPDTPPVRPMHRCLALFLAALVLLQTLGQEVLVVDYQLHKARITELYCVNKARPMLHCNGRCHLMKQLRKADDAEKKAPAGAWSKVRYEALPAAAFVLPQPARWPLAPRRYPDAPGRYCAAVPVPGVFRPPLLPV